MRTPVAAMTVGSLLLLAAAPRAHAEPVRPGEEPTFDLGILPPSTPDVLKAAALAPYVAPAGESCEGVAREIAALDAVLGPDADAPKQAGGGGAGKFVGQAVKSLIPYRSVVRFVTGADRKQRERNQAAMAGWARRGYLKGLQAAQGCPGATAPAPTVAAAAPPPVLEVRPAGGAVADAHAVVSDPASGPAPEAAPLPAAAPNVRLVHAAPPAAETVETTFAR